MEDCTVVIFLNTHHKDDVERFNQLLYPSIKFIKEKIIVVPKNVYYLKIDASYRLLLDEKIVGNNYSIKPYDKQMILKLYISKFINTKYYLILDSDNIVNKEFVLKDFFNTNNKICLSVYNGSKYINSKTNHGTWIKNGCNILDIKKVKEPFYYANTPVLMITSIVNELTSFLDKKTNNFLKYYKEYNRWKKYSEYTLYFLYTQYYNLYENDNEEPGLISGMWTKKCSFNNLDYNSIFYVIQSHLNYNIDEIKNKIPKKEHYNLSKIFESKNLFENPFESYKFTTAE